MTHEGRTARVRNAALAIREQKRVVILFLLAIVLPAAILGFFGLRALGADRIRIEGLLRRESEELLSQDESRLRAGMAALSQALGNFDRDKAGVDLPGALVRVSPEGDVSFVRERYRIRARLNDPRLDPDGRILLEAETLEHAKRRPDLARERYLALSRRTDPYIRSLALLGLGRASATAGNFDAALTAYRTLLAEVPEELDRDTSTHIMIASLQAARILTPKAEALSPLVEAYQLLLRDRWIVDSDVVRFYASTLEEAIDKLCAEHAGEVCDNYRCVRAKRDERLRSVEKLEALAAELAPMLSSWGASDLPPDDLVVELPETGSWIVAARTGDGSAMATLIAEKKLAEYLLGPHVLEPERRVMLEVVNSRGDTLWGAPGSPVKGSAATKRELGNGLPTWTLSAFHASGVDLLAGRRNLYLGFTTLLAMWLIFGAVLTARSLRQEMKLVGMKSHFVSMVSHEFKSPITSLRALLEVLRSGSVDDWGRMRHYVGVASAELQRLTRLVNNLLDTSRMEAGTRRYHLVPTDVAGLIRDQLLHFEARAAELGIRVESWIEPVPPIPADADAVSQAVLNLLDNALKHAGEEKWIGLRLAGEADGALIEVSDRGTGVASETVQDLIEMSRRVDGRRSDDDRGLGLGLAIVAHVAEGHGGWLTVRRRPGGGSTFQFLIPHQTSSGNEASGG